MEIYTNAREQTAVAPSFFRSAKLVVEFRIRKKQACWACSQPAIDVIEALSLFFFCKQAEKGTVLQETADDDIDLVETSLTQ